MSVHEHQRPAPYKRYSREGFQVLSGRHGDSSISIPMHQVTPPSSSWQNPPAPPNEKAPLYPTPHPAGQRKSLRGTIPLQGAGFAATAPQPHEEEDVITRMGVFYDKFFKAHAATRYFTYILPLGLIISVPIIVGAILNSKGDPKQSTVGTVPTQWLFAWVLVSWVGLWTSKLFAHFLPRIFQFLCGIVSSGVRKYALIIQSLEIPISLVGWAVVTLATFEPICVTVPNQKNPGIVDSPHWITVVQRILAAATVSSIIFLVERLFIQLISINYHRKQFRSRIKDSKHDIYLLSLLYDASRAMFPAFCPEFADEDAIVNDTIDIKLNGTGRKGKKQHNPRSGSVTPMRILQGAERFGDRLTSAFGNVAHEVTGKNVFNPNSAHSVVVEALEKNKSAEALARRIWLSFVVEGNDALFMEDVVEVLGAGRQPEAEECFAALDRDQNGDVSLDEMIQTVTEYGRERYAIANSMHDVDQAINVLDGLLCVVVVVAIIFIFVAFLNTSFVTTLATAGTALLSLSFVFSVTCQEVLGSCIFLFVKHPFDIGDRVEITQTQLVVEHISLLFTVFRQVTTGQLVQIPNIVLNTLWIDNITRSKAMREQLSIYVDFNTTFEDVQLLKAEMTKFVQDKENNRDFFPDIEIQVISLEKMDKLQLQIDIMHKSNWANETVRATRRSKFMCALVLAIRKVPIAGPGGPGKPIGDPANPSYSVAISDDQAAKNKAALAEQTENARLVPTRKMEPKSPAMLASPSEQKAFNSLHERSPALDGARDEPDAFRDPDRNKGQSSELEEVRGVLRRTTTKGKRKSAKSITGLSVTEDNRPETPRIDVAPPRIDMTAEMPRNNGIPPSSIQTTPNSFVGQPNHGGPRGPRQSSEESVQALPTLPSTGYTPPASRTPRNGNNRPYPSPGQSWRY